MQRSWQLEFGTLGVLCEHCQQNAEICQSALNSVARQNDRRIFESISVEQIRQLDLSFATRKWKKLLKWKKNAVAWCVVSSLIFNSIFHWPEQRIIKTNIFFLLSLRPRSLMTSSWIFIVALHKPVRYYYSRLQLLFYFRLFFSSFETNHWICIPLNCLIWCIIEYCFKCNSKLQLKTSLGFYQLKFSFISNVHEEMFYLKISVWNALESAFVVKIAFAWSFQLAIITSPLWVEGIDLSGNRKVQ